MISKEISSDILIYLKQVKGYSIEEMANATGSSTIHIDNIINNKSLFTAENINFYLKFSNTSFWKFAYDAIPLDHLNEKSRKKIKICKELSDHIKKNT